MFKASQEILKEKDMISMHNKQQKRLRRCEEFEWYMYSEVTSKKSFLESVRKDIEVCCCKSMKPLFCWVFDVLRDDRMIGP